MHNNSQISYNRLSLAHVNPPSNVVYSFSWKRGFIGAVVQTGCDENGSSLIILLLTLNVSAAVQFNYFATDYCFDKACKFS